VVKTRAGNRDQTRHRCTSARKHAHVITADPLARSRPGRSSRQPDPRRSDVKADYVRPYRMPRGNLCSDPHQDAYARDLG